MTAWIGSRVARPPTTTPAIAANPYWNRCGRTYLDPDGYRIVIAAADPAD